MGLMNISFSNEAACNGIQEDCFRSVDGHVIWALFCIIVVPYVVTVLHSLWNLNVRNLQKMSISYLLTVRNFIITFHLIHKAI
jgi:hypothetical protein